VINTIEIIEDTINKKMCEYPDLELENISNLSQEEAEKIGDYEWSNIYIDSLQDISIDIVKAITKKKVSVLHLRGLTSITSEVAEYLACIRTKVILRNLTILLPDEAYFLPSISFLDWLSFPYLVEVQPEIAKQLLAGYRHNSSVESLSLPAISNVSADTAQYLAGFKELNLENLKFPSCEVLQSFSSSPFLQNLTIGIIRMSEEYANILSLFEGERLNLPSLRYLDQSTAKILGNCRVNRLHFTDLDLTVQTANNLACFSGHILDLKIDAISNSIAQQLAGFSGFSICLNICVIDLELAVTLASFKCSEIYLYNISESTITDNEKEALLEFPGEVYTEDGTLE
jgi:hypothetical protein